MRQVRAALPQQGAVGLAPGHVRALPQVRPLPWSSPSGDLRGKDLQAASGQLRSLRSDDGQVFLRQAHAACSQDPVGRQGWSSTSDRGELIGSLNIVATFLGDNRSFSFRLGYFGGVVPNLDVFVDNFLDRLGR